MRQLCPTARRQVRSCGSYCTSGRQQQLVWEHRGPRSVSPDSCPRPLLMALCPREARKTDNWRPCLWTKNPSPCHPQAHLALVSAVTDLVLPHFVWGAPVAPRPLLFVLRNGNPGPSGQASSARENNLRFAVTYSQPGPAPPPPPPASPRVGEHMSGDDGLAVPIRSARPPQTA